MNDSSLLLDSLDQESRDQLLEGHRVINIPAQHQLLFQSDWGEEVYFVSSGLLKVRCLTSNGDEIVIAIQGPGAVIGDLAVLSPRPLRSADVVSLTPATLLKLRQRAFQEVMGQSAPFTRAVAHVQAQRLSSLGERLILMHEDATTRLLATLSLLARLNGPADDPRQVIPPISQQDIAVIAGLSRGTTSTLITKLRNNQTLEQTPQGLRFVQLSALERRGLLPKGGER
ncbi:MAG: Crp/Fnr family transcriptional regulator [Cyanobacteriota bacterium]|jgi:CRP/FNR family cyclic AMP-dependent transcriptional regulator